MFLPNAISANVLSNERIFFFVHFIKTACVSMFWEQGELQVAE